MSTTSSQIRKLSERIEILKNRISDNPPEEKLEKDLEELKRVVRKRRLLRQRIQQLNRVLRSL